MKSRWLLLVFSLSFLFVPFAHFDASATEKEDSKSEVIAEIRAVLSTQQEAWNHGDIDGFMNGYDRAKMGTLTFSDLEIEQLGGDSAIALGRWELKRANDNPHGRFTLIFRHTPDGWRIVHDHTWAAAPP